MWGVINPTNPTNPAAATAAAVNSDDAVNIAILFRSTPIPSV
jgi:hypothetical protein